MGVSCGKDIRMVWYDVLTVGLRGLEAITGRCRDGDIVWWSNGYHILEEGGVIIKKISGREVIVSLRGGLVSVWKLWKNVGKNVITLYVRMVK